MKDTTKTKHMTGLMDKAIAKLIKMNLIDMESFSTHQMAVKFEKIWVNGT
jgi:hypothetical protein